MFSIKSWIKAFLVMFAWIITAIILMLIFDPALINLLPQHKGMVIALMVVFPLVSVLVSDSVKEELHHKQDPNANSAKEYPIPRNRLFFMGSRNAHNNENPLNTK